MRFERELLKGVAPVVVLEVLSRGAMYGYELSEAIERRSEQILTLGRGTLYPLLYNLEGKGLVRAWEEEQENGRTRRYYELTGKGKKYLAAQKEQLRQLQDAVGLVFGWARPAGA